ncbi:MULTISPECIES: hypothetical protein [Acaryochloris]|uniref:hypothetical protein n=1 Tax=Acaryochloris TaxID=155977 RepID=UPI0011126D88|nr:MULTISPECIES: hypothetical protein [Acaryochloris]KAI9130347.1 hypothetical protein ON05_021140 [Acaryochloris sp. CCMEE 5410]
MLCDTCQRKRACLPLALAQTDTALFQQLDSLQHCDRQLIPTTSHLHKVRYGVGAIFRHLKNLLLLCTASVYHRFLVNSG